MQKPQGEHVLDTFQAIAHHYDRMNGLLSLGLHQTWRRKALDSLDIMVGGTALDIGCGTCDLTVMLSRRVGPGGRVVGLDFSPLMLQQGADKCRRQQAANVQLLQGDALALPFPDNSFRYVTTAFTLRNVSDLRQALREMQRVLVPGGRLLILDLAHPENLLVRRVYHYCLRQVLPRMADWLVGRGNEYSWLSESLQSFPDNRRLLQLISEAGLCQPRARLLMGGVIAFHVAAKAVVPLEHS